VDKPQDREGWEKCTTWRETGIFEVLMAEKMTMLLFWVVIPCRLIGRYQHFKETLDLPMSQHSITTQDNIIRNKEGKVHDFT
jgi:hypothetical protein